MSVEHKDIADPNIHEPRGASQAPNGYVLVANGQGGTSWVPATAAVDVASFVVSRQLEGFSYVDQTTTTGDSPVQVSFGPEQNDITNNVMISSAGVVTFNKGGFYRASIVLEYENPDNNTTNTIFHFRPLTNGTQQGNTLTSIIVPGHKGQHQQESWFNFAEGSTLSYEFMLDSAGATEGGLISSQPTLAGWEPSASAVIMIDALIQP